MIGIQTHTEEILKYLPQVGISRHQVIVNPSTTSGLKCIVSVGGPGVRNAHCYIQSGDSLPFIQCLDPETVRAEPVNKVFILCALRKAKEVAEHGYRPLPVHIKIAPSMDDVVAFFAGYDDVGKLSVDIETDPSTCELTTIGFAYGDETIHAISIPFASENKSYWPEEDEARIWRMVAGVMHASTPKVMQNFIFDTMILSKYGIETTGPIYDTLTAAHWLSPELPKDLGTLGRMFLMCDVWKGQNSWVSNETLWEYNAKDAAYTLLILRKQMEAMEHDKRLEFFEKQLTPLSIEVLRMCERGWTLDPKALAHLTSTLEHQSGALRKNLLDIASDFVRPRVKYMLRKGKPKIGIEYATGVGNRKSTKAIQFDEYEDFIPPDSLKQLKEYRENGIQIPIFEKISEEHVFNPSSFRDVREVLIGLGVKIPMRDGCETVDELALLKILEKLDRSDPLQARAATFIECLLEYRGKAKLLSTYCKAIPDSDGKYRFSVVIPGTVEARFSSRQTPWGTGFNSQNIPKSFRHLSVPSQDDYCIVNLDFKAADPHMVAWLSGEKQMQQILESGGDLHAHTASAIYGRDITIDTNWKDSRERKLGKACNNGLNYGMQTFKFIETARKQGLNLSFAEAEAAFKAYFKLYPGIRLWQTGIKNTIDRTRTLFTPFGRKRYFFGYLNDKTYNAALAWVPPSTVADALNAGWLNFLPAAKDFSANILQQCHDSLKLECPKRHLDAVAESLLSSYKQVSFQIGGVERTLPVEIEFGPNWGTLKKWSSSKSI